MADRKRWPMLCSGSWPSGLFDIDEAQTLSSLVSLFEFSNPTDQGHDDWAFLLDLIEKCAGVVTGLQRTVAERVDPFLHDRISARATALEAAMRSALVAIGKGQPIEGSEILEEALDPNPYADDAAAVRALVDEIHWNGAYDLAWDDWLNELARNVSPGQALALYRFLKSREEPGG